MHAIWSGTSRATSQAVSRPCEFVDSLPQEWPAKQPAPPTCHAFDQLIAIGAPAAAYYGEVARRLGAVLGDFDDAHTAIEEAKRIARAYVLAAALRSSASDPQVDTTVSERRARTNTGDECLAEATVCVRAVSRQ